MNYCLSGTGRVSFYCRDLIAKLLQPSIGAVDAKEGRGGRGGPTVAARNSTPSGFYVGFIVPISDIQYAAGAIKKPNVTFARRSVKKYENI